MPHAHAQNTELELVYFFLEAGFFLVADFFLGAAFLAGDFFTAFLAGDFLAAAGFLAADFFLAAAGFLAMVFLTAGFLAGDFLTGFLAADFLAAAGFCDGGSGGPTSVLVDSSLTRAMPRCAHAGMQYAIRAAILGDANRAFANAGAGVPWREAWLSLRTGSGRGHQLVCARAQRVAAFARALCAAVQRMGISRLFFWSLLNGKVTKRPLLNYSPVRQQQEIGGENKRAVRVPRRNRAPPKYGVPDHVCARVCRLS